MLFVRNVVGLLVLVSLGTLNLLAGKFYLPESSTILFQYLESSKCFPLNQPVNTCYPCVFEIMLILTIMSRKSSPALLPVAPPTSLQVKACLAEFLIYIAYMGRPM